MKSTSDKEIYNEEKIDKWRKERLNVYKRLMLYIPFLGVIGGIIFMTEFTYGALFWGSLFIGFCLLIEYYTYGAYRNETLFLKIYEDRIELPHIKGFRLKQWVIPIKKIEKVKMNIEKPYESPSDYIILKKGDDVVGKICKDDVYSIEDFKKALKKVDVKVID